MCMWRCRTFYIEIGVCIGFFYVSGGICLEGCLDVDVSEPVPLNMYPKTHKNTLQHTAVMRCCGVY